LRANPETALAHFVTAETIDRQVGDKKSLSNDLQNLADVETSLGRLSDAVDHCTEALETAAAAKDHQEKLRSRAYLAFAASLQGEMLAAAEAFADANAIWESIYGTSLESAVGLKWAEHLLRSGQTERARGLTSFNRQIAVRLSWQQDVAGCDWMLGWLDVAERQYHSAHSYLDLAEATFTRGHMVHELARVHLTRAACRLGEGYLDPAEAAVELALDLAAPRNYRLIHADGLILRARIALARSDATAARNDAESGLQIAEPCEYAWAERDACEVLANAWGTLGNRTEAARYAERDAILRRRLTPTGR
jgi:tetratricopeptide (TPR) repeat protein